MSEIMNCPFCGGEAELHDGVVIIPVIDENGAYIDADVEDTPAWVECAACGAATDGVDSADEAITAWNRRAQPSEKPKPLTLMLGGGKYWIADYVCPDSGDVGICAYPRESDDGVIGAADSSCVGKSTDDVGAVLKIEFSKLESIDVVIRALEKAKANYRSKPKEGI